MTLLQEIDETKKQIAKLQKELSDLEACLAEANAALAKRGLTHGRVYQEHGEEATHDA